MSGKELSNIRVAFEWYTKDEDRSTEALRLAIAMSRFWRYRGNISEARQRLDISINHPGAKQPTLELAKALNNAGVLAAIQSDYNAALEYYQMSIALFRSFNDSRSVGGMLNNLANLMRNSGDFVGAFPLYEESLQISKKMNYLELKATVLMNIGENFRRKGDNNSGKKSMMNALAIFRQLNAIEGIATTLSMIASVSRNDDAEIILAESLALFQILDEKEGIALVKRQIAGIRLECGDITNSLSHFNDSLVISKELGDKTQIMMALIGISRIALLKKDAELGILLLSAADQYRKAINSSLLPIEILSFEQAYSTARGMTSPQRFELLWENGQSETLENICSMLNLPPEMIV